MIAYSVLVILHKKQGTNLRLSSPNSSHHRGHHYANHVSWPCAVYVNGMSHTAAQIWNLANLPLMIGDKVLVEDANWECFLLLDILQFCTVRVSSSAHAGILEALIHSHHELFIRCYPDSSVTPKMHYMVHFPNQIIRYVGFYCHIAIICTKWIP